MLENLDRLLGLREKECTVITRLVAVCVKGIADIDASARELCHEVLLFRPRRHGHKPTLATSKVLFSIRAVAIA
jgi:hypothetical protein